MVAAMKPGSVIVDMAAEQGGNCELTEPGNIRDVNGVKIVGYTDLASRLPTQASKLYGTNMAHLLKHMEIGKGWKIDMGEEIVRGALVAHQGQITSPPPSRMIAPFPNCLSIWVIASSTAFPLSVSVPIAASLTFVCGFVCVDPIFSLSAFPPVISPKRGTI